MTTVSDPEWLAYCDSVRLRLLNRTETNTEAENEWRRPPPQREERPRDKQSYMMSVFTERFHSEKYRSNIKKMYQNSYSTRFYQNWSVVTICVCCVLTPLFIIIIICDLFTELTQCYYVHRFHILLVPQTEGAGSVTKVVQVIRSPQTPRWCVQGGTFKTHSWETETKTSGLSLFISLWRIRATSETQVVTNYIIYLLKKSCSRFSNVIIVSLIVLTVIFLKRNMNGASKKWNKTKKIKGNSLELTFFMSLKTRINIFRRKKLLGIKTNDE